MEEISKSAVGLKKYDMANMFSAYREGDEYFFYLGRTLTFDNIESLSEKFVTKHTWRDEDTWYKLAHLYYENSKLWWIICRANNVSNPFEFPEVGTIVNVPNKSVVNSIISKIAQ